MTFNSLIIYDSLLKFECVCSRESVLGGGFIVHGPWRNHLDPGPDRRSRLADRKRNPSGKLTREMSPCFYYGGNWNSRGDLMTSVQTITASVSDCDELWLCSQQFAVRHLESRTQPLPKNPNRKTGSHFCTAPTK